MLDPAVVFVQFLSLFQFLSFWLYMGQVETEETENGNGKLKRKTEAEIGNGKAEIGKWSSTFVALMASFAHARSI